MNVPMTAISNCFRRNLVVLRLGDRRCDLWRRPMEEWNRSLSSLRAQSDTVAAEARNAVRREFLAAEGGRCRWYSSIGTWSKLCNERQVAEVVSMLDLLVQQGSYVSNSMLYSVLKRCIEEKDLGLGTRIHALAVKSGYESDAFLANHIIRMYASHGRLEEAMQVFAKVVQPDRYMWSSIILAHARQGQPAQAINLFRRIWESTVVPDNHIFVAALTACATAEDLASGKEIHSAILQTAHKPNVYVGNCLVDMYAKCRSLEHARRVFDSLLRKNVVTWNTMMAGYAQHGLGPEVLNLFRSMQQEGVIAPDAVTFACLLQACGSIAGLDTGKEIHAQISKTGLDTTDLYVASTLINMYSKCGSMVEAQKVFDALHVRDIVTWNALIAGYTRQGESELVFDLFHRMMEEGIHPNDITFLSVLTVCSHVGLVDKGQKYFEVMTKDHGTSPTMKHYNCMVDLFGRAGQMDKAMEMVSSMPFQPHGQVWRSVLGACRKWNNVAIGRQAFESAIRLNQHDAAAYDLMSNIYETACMWEEAKDIQTMKVQAQAWKEPGQSWWTDLAGAMYTFAVGER